MSKPKLRAIGVHPIEHQGQEMLLLRDPLSLSKAQIAVPRALGPLLALMDGTRSAEELEAALQVRAGVRLAPGLLPKLLNDLEEAYLLDSERYVQAKADTLQAFRESPFRPLAVDGGGVPPRSDLAAELLQAYMDALPPGGAKDGTVAKNGSVRGLVSPHIDYQRGGPVYAQVWREVAEAARQAEVVIILGTDHQGSEAMLTCTRQSYGTPWGILPTDLEVVEALAAALGEDAVYAEELHHRDEHSVELAAVWLHFVRGGEPVPMVPILCGHFGAFVEGNGEPAGHGPFSAAVEVLRDVLAKRRTLVVAAADLAHVGPAFGDPYGLDYVAKAQLQNADERLLASIYAGDAEGFFEQLRMEGDRRNICGLPPIYLTLRLLDETRGEPAGYALCPADPQGMSFVTIAGVVFR
jgi:AmmeMemoRadiSam system protein B